MLKINMNIFYQKHKSVFFIKIKLQRYTYVVCKTKNIHTYPKHKWVHNRIYMKARDSRVYMYIYKFLDKNSIYMKQNIYKNRENMYK